MRVDHAVSKLGAFAVIALAGGATGCMGWHIEPETVVHQGAKTSSSTLVIAEITHPRDLTVSAPFYVAMQREIPQQIAAAHISEQVVPERDLGTKGVAGPAYVLRYRVVEDHIFVARTGGACVGALVGTGCFTIIPLFFLGLCTRDAQHDLTIEARVFDVTNVPVQKLRDASSNEMLNVYDTSSLTALSRKEYKVAVDVVGRAFGGQLDATEVLELTKKEAGEAVRQLLAQSLEDVTHALH